MEKQLFILSKSKQYVIDLERLDVKKEVGNQNQTRIKDQNWKQEEKKEKKKQTKQKPKCYMLEV